MMSLGPGLMLVLRTAFKASRSEQPHLGITRPSFHPHHIYQRILSLRCMFTYNLCQVKRCCHGVSIQCAISATTSSPWQSEWTCSSNLSTRSYEYYVSCIPVKHCSKLDCEVDFENNGADLHLVSLAAPKRFGARARVWCPCVQRFVPFPHGP